MLSIVQTQRHRGGWIRCRTLDSIVIALSLGLCAVVAADEPGGLVNLSVRAVAAAGDNALSAGFVIAGPGPKRVLVRAAGPSLASFGVSGALAEVRLELYQGSTLLDSNSGWDAGGGAASVEQAIRAVGAFAFARGSADAALLAELGPGAYTARVVPARDALASGVTLAEIYDADSSSPARLVNLSARAGGGVGAEALIAGFVVAGEGRNRLLVRAAGPALAAFGLPGAMRDPQLELFRNETSIGYNDDWDSNTNPAQLAVVSSAIGAFAFEPGMKDAALLLPAANGVYTAATTAATGNAGVALIEVYDTATVRAEIVPRTFDLVGFGRVPGHGLNALSGGGAANQPYDPRTGSGNFWRIDEGVATAADFPAQFRAAMASDRPLVIELDTMLDLSRVAFPSNGATAIAHPELFSAGRDSGSIGLLAVGSNKTVYSAFGAGGFRRGTLRIDGTQNIILRNLKFRELWEWDDATLGQYDRNDWDYLTILSRFAGAGVTARAHHVWIDHCDFEKSYDGLFDVVQGADLITVSWCKLAGVMSGETARWVRRQFEYLAANPGRFPSYRLFRDSVGAAALRQREIFQHKGNLVGNSPEPLTAERDRGHLNVTFHHNWYFNVDQRMPRMRFGNAHLFNLLADSSAGRGLLALSLAGVVATSGAAVRIENAWFAGLRTPVSILVDTELPGTILVRNSINYDQTTGVRAALDLLQAAAGGVFAWNQPDPRTGISGWPVANPNVMPAGYTPPGTSLANYLDFAEDMSRNLMWVGVFVPADAAEAELLRTRWQSTGL
jgi:pectate lyase